MDTRSPSGLQDYVSIEIRVLLTRRRMTAQDLANKLGWSSSQLSRKLSGQAAFTISDLDQISRALQIRLADLLPADTGAGCTWTSFLQADCEVAA